MRTNVVIVGGGPAGLLLSQLLNRDGIETVVLERRSAAYVCARIRAGVLEAGTQETLRLAGAGARMEREGHVHHGCAFGLAKRQFRIDFQERCGKSVMVYGQTEVTKDLYDAQAAIGATVIDEAENVALYDVTTETPFVTFRKGGQEHRIDCDYIAGCDGFHGVSRLSIPAQKRTEYERVYPFGWLGILSETPPVSHELIYANHERGFALASMRNPHLSRYYIQVSADESHHAWSDDAFWDELRHRLPHEAAESIVTGPSIEKSVAPLRSFVCEPMQWGRLYLCGDAAHIVPPTGAKGLNLAVSDVYYLWQAMLARYKEGDLAALDHYGHHALSRVWKSVRFSWWLTTMLHRFPDQTAFDQRIQEADLEHLADSPLAQAALAEAYTGVPY